MDKLRKRLRTWYNAVWLWLYLVNAWLNTTSIFVLVGIGVTLGLLVIFAMVSAGVRT